MTEAARYQPVMVEVGPADHETGLPGRFSRTQPFRVPAAAIELRKDAIRCFGMNSEHQEVDGF